MRDNTDSCVASCTGAALLAGRGPSRPGDRLAPAVASDRPTVRPSNRPTGRRVGFTLIELLAVIVIIAILLGIMTGAAQFVVKVAREKRLTLSCRALESAMARYRHEYGAWPIPVGASGNYDTAYGGPYAFNVSGERNKEWFYLLRATPNNTFNPKQIRWVDETTIFTVADARVVDREGRLIAQEGQRVPLHLVRQTNPDLKTPFVGISKQGKTVYFGIRIDVDADTVQVTSP
jgi:prepilin-type N-terminal cleavage/methylation domain-containing protein